MIKPVIVMFMLGWLVGNVWFDCGWRTALMVPFFGWPINVERRG